MARPTITPHTPTTTREILLRKQTVLVSRGVLASGKGGTKVRREKKRGWCPVPSEEKITDKGFSRTEKREIVKINNEESAQGFV